MHRLFTIAVAAGVLWLVLSMVVIISTKDDRVALSFVPVPINHFAVENAHMVYDLGDGGYINLLSDRAYLNRDTGLLTLNAVNMLMYDGVNSIETVSDDGIYVLNERLTLSGDVNGIWNDVQYFVGEDGSFTYSFIDEKARAGERVTLIDENTAIDAAFMDYDLASRTVKFSGGVEVDVLGDFDEI